MTQRQQWGIVAGIVLLLAVVLGAGVHFLGDELFPVSVGSKAPPIQGVTLDSAKREKSLADYRGKVVLLNVWATWCEPCRQEMPSMQTLYTTLAGPDFEMLAVSSDQSERKVVEQFVQTYRLSFPVLPDPDLQVAGRYRVTGYPETFVIDRNGTIVAHEIGPRHWDAPDSVTAFRGLIARGEWSGLS